MVEQLDCENEILDFLKQWFFGLIKGFETQSLELQSKILHHCGTACAHPQAAAFFQETWQKSKNLEDFLEHLNQRYNSNVFNKIDNNSILVQYTKCYCPLRQLELLDSSILRDCASSWLGEVFESALRTSVDIKTQKTMCDGAKTCKFKVNFVQREIDLQDFQSYLKQAIELKNQVKNSDLESKKPE